MGISKTEIFSVKQNTMATLIKALGHPARIAIMEYLLKKNSCVCGDIVLEIGLAQPTISQHLKELKNVGLIQGTIDGTSVCYCINIKTFQKLNNYLSSISNKLTELKSTCC